LKTDQGLIPKVVELFTQCCDAGGIDSVDSSRADRFFFDQPSVLQDLQVLRYRRPSDGQLRRQGADGQWPRREQQDDRPPRPIPKGRPDVPLSVSLH
jgi:hypothetical protein